MLLGTRVPAKRQYALAPRPPPEAGPSSTHLHRSGPAFVPGVKARQQNYLPPRGILQLGRQMAQEILAAKPDVIGSLRRTERGPGGNEAEIQRSPALSSGGLPSASRRHRAGRCPGRTALSQPRRLGCSEDSFLPTYTCDLLSGQVCPHLAECGFPGTVTFTPPSPHATSFYLSGLLCLETHA